ncbi:FHA domain-containing protein [Myxococcota bacterium]|nr:FHA domain-containing protein [Myxococcota bacterium]MBU1381787.1 FHA domain-containing protein [Myxococcota bacterium]MBU1498677.1 FHA domain-containing protein [Myxococcota bacterium]
MCEEWNVKKYGGLKINNRYLIVEILRQGRYSLTYRGIDTVDMRSIFIKLIRNSPIHLENPELVHISSDLLVSMENAFCPEFIDAGDDFDGLRWVVSAFWPGETVADATLKRPAGFSYEWTARIIRSVAIGLDFLHTNGIVHGGIRPANIFLIDDCTGELKWSERTRIIGFSNSRFGPAAMACGHHRLNQEEYGPIPVNAWNQFSDSELKGPEEAWQDYAADDIKGLGTVLFFMITKQYPGGKQKKDMETLEKIFNRDPAAILGVSYELYNSFVNIIRRCLEKDVKRRYNNIAEVCNDIETAHRQENYRLQRMIPLNGFASRFRRSGEFSLSLTSEPTYALMQVYPLSECTRNPFVFRANKPFTIGRSSRSSLQVFKDDVSRRHAKLVTVDNQCWIKDTKSLYGTYINEVPVKEYTMLYSGDVIRIASTMWAFMRLEDRETINFYTQVIYDMDMLTTVDLPGYFLYKIKDKATNVYEKSDVKYRKPYKFTPAAFQGKDAFVFRIRKIHTDNHVVSDMAIGVYARRLTALIANMSLSEEFHCVRMTENIFLLFVSKPDKDRGTSIIQKCLISALRTGIFKVNEQDVKIDADVYGAHFPDKFRGTPYDIEIEFRNWFQQIINEKPAPT